MSKQPNEIALKVTRYDIEEGIRTGSSTYKCRLSDKLTEYVTKLGYTNAAIYNVIVHLLSEGKIRLDFRSYIERIELLDPSDKLPRVQAIAMVDEYLSKARGGDPGLGATQRIVIQPPKPPS